MNIDKAWKEAKKAVKKEMKKSVKEVGGVDVSRMHRVAMETIKKFAPEANEELVSNLGWQVWMSVR